MSLLAFEEALRRILEPAATVTEQETLPLAEAAGRVLATDLAARLTQPPFDTSAMDGYALRACDAGQAGAEFTVTGVSAAGHGFAGTVGPGEAVRIFTGAPLPGGADAVLIQEDAEILGGNRIRAASAVAQWKNIRPRGQDFREGETVIHAGTVMDFPLLTVAAAMDHADIPVLRRPLVALLATGDELVYPGEARTADQIVASSIYGAAALMRAAGADVLDLGIARDETAAIAAAVDRARAAKADILVTLGGVSAGDHDLVRPVLQSLGMEPDFWRIALRPGKPLMVGRFGAMHAIGLPGNPVSTLVCSLLFIEPLIRKLGGLPPIRRAATARTATGLKANDHRQDYMRARLFTAPDGTLVAEAADKQDSSQTKVLALSDCLIVRPPNAPPLEAGSPCPIILLHHLTDTPQS